MPNLIEHVFVLMLENRAFDHMLGFSGITGQDAANGGSTQINGLTGSEANTFNGREYQVTKGADDVMPADPGHEFNNVLEQLCGAGATYQAGGAYPAINNAGFVASYVASGGAANPGEVMKCFAPEQLPVLIALAQEFAVCDNWHASLPGPTWPNRMFVHAASSGGLDHSPTTEEIVEWETIGGFQFKAGSIFDALKSKGVSRRLYAGDDFPMVAALKGISLFDIRHYSNFASDLGQSTYPYSYVFIEPSYDVLNDYKNSTSQHPLTDITLGEGLIKETYEAIRNSPHWNNSVLIITWDEHGGFYDHAIPAGAVEPGDTAPQDKRNQYGFTFQQYGPRVPAVVISPLVPKNVVDHRLYDHGSIPATIEAFFSTILQRVSAPLKKADLLVVAHYLIGHLTYSQVPALAKRHKVEVKNESGSAQEVLTKQVSKYDESELCKLLLEVSLWDSACQRPTTSGNDILLDSANRYRVDAEKLQKAIAEDWDANRAKKRKNKVKTRC